MFSLLQRLEGAHGSCGEDAGFVGDHDGHRFVLLRSQHQAYSWAEVIDNNG